MCHSCVSRNPDHRASSFLDSRLRGNDTMVLALQGRGELVHSAKVFQDSLEDRGVRLASR